MVSRYTSFLSTINRTIAARTPLPSQVAHSTRLRLSNNFLKISNQRIATWRYNRSFSSDVEADGGEAPIKHTVQENKPRGPNEDILEMLRQYEIKENKSPNKNGYKIRAYKAAIKIIGHQDYPIRTFTQATRLPGIGFGIAKRITDFLVRREEYGASLSPSEIKDDDKRRTLIELGSVPGVGVRKAVALYNAGCRTPDKIGLPKYNKLIPNALRTQIRFKGHLEQPNTREDAEAVYDALRSSLTSSFEINLVGDYRRGASTLSSIAILLLHPQHVHIPLPTVLPSTSNKRNWQSTKTFFGGNITEAGKRNSTLYREGITHLEKRGIIACTSMGREKKWQGVIRLPKEGEETRNRVNACRSGNGTFKLVDIYFAPQKARGAALLLLTGDREFNRVIRLRALQLGLHLNEYGLWKWNATQPEHIEDNPDQELTQSGYWELMRTETEEDIMAELGMDWTDPTERDFELLGPDKNKNRL